MRKIWIDLKIVRRKSVSNCTYTFNYWNPLVYIMFIVMPIIVGVVGFFVMANEAIQELKRYVR